MRQINENTEVEIITCIIYIKWMSSIKVANQNYSWLPLTLFTKNRMINQFTAIHVIPKNYIITAVQTKNFGASRILGMRKCDGFH